MPGLPVPHMPGWPVPPLLLYHILYRIFLLLLIQLHISHRSARSLPEYVLLHMPELPVLHILERLVPHMPELLVLHMPGLPVPHMLERLVLHMPERPVLHMPGRLVLHMPERPVLHTPELPVLHMPGRPAVLQIDFHRMYRTVHLPLPSSDTSDKSFLLPAAVLVKPAFQSLIHIHCKIQSWQKSVLRNSDN